MKKIVSLILVAIMLIACVPNTMLTAFAINTNMDESVWPGKPMVLCDGANNIYCFRLPEEYNCFIFSDGHSYYGYNDGVAWQTNNIAYTGANRLYIPVLGDTVFKNGATRCSVNVENYTKGAQNDRMIYFKAPYNWDAPSCYCWKNTNTEWLEQEKVNAYESMISNKIGKINLGPYAINGATIEVAGYDIPLMKLEAAISLDLGDNLHIEIDEKNNKVKVLMGFDQKESADIGPEGNSTKYWSESYKEVKSMYQNLTGKKVDTTRLWNKFSSLRGKLKKANANMMVNVDASIAGYAEFKISKGECTFLEGGVLASFDANTTIRHYPFAGVYVALGLGVGVDGSLKFVNENNKINPQIKVSPELTVSLGAGIGTKSTYAQIDGYGTIKAEISTSNTSTPFRAGLDLGVKWCGYIIGKEIFSDDKTFASLELYPNYGSPWSMRRLALTPDIDVSDANSYDNLIDSSETIDRNYMMSTYSLRSSVNLEGIDFQKRNVYPFSEPQIVNFDDDTMLLIWVDDNGEKTLENRCSLMYSYFDGEQWSTPTTIYEDGMSVDMPDVYSDGRYAYIVWQKATKVFEEGIETTEMLQNYDLYAMIFDSDTRTFSEQISLANGDNAIFEFEPVIYGSNGDFNVCWLENSDNNVFQMSGENTLRKASFNYSSGTIEYVDVLITTDVFKGMVTNGDNIVYSVLESESNNLYVYDGVHSLIAENVNDFACANGLVFYSNYDGFYSYGSELVEYSEVGSIDQFSVEYKNGVYALFLTKLNEDFTKSLYYSKMSTSDNKWTNFELYYGDGTYIRNYSPVISSDGTVYVAFNNVLSDEESDTETAVLQVGKCTDDIDVALSYADFDDGQLGTGNVDLNMEIVNNSSAVFDKFNISLTDSVGNVVYQETVSHPLAPFSTDILTINMPVPANGAEKYTVSVLPEGYNDYDETNNSVVTTFECVHKNSTGWVVEIHPTLSSSGFETYSCDYCGEVLETKEIKGCDFIGSTVTLSGNIGVDFHMTLSESVVADENAKVVFTLPNGNKKSVAVSSVTPDEKGNYVFSCEIAAKEMTKTITAQVVTSDDKSEVFEYSVIDYADYVLAEAEAGNETYTAAAPLVKAMLNYGAYAQKHFGYNTENLANDILEDADKALPEDIDLSNYGYKLSDNDDNISYYGSALSLKSETTIKHYFIVNDDAEVPAFYVNGEEVEAVKKGNRYEVKIEDIPAHCLGGKYVVTAGGLTLDYNALSYANLALKTGNETLKDAMTALYAYNVAAKEYIAQQ